MKRFYLLFLVLAFFYSSFQESIFAQEGTRITQTTEVEVKLNSVLHVSCHGDQKGAIDIMVSGGVPPYKYKWSNGATSQDIAGLAAGKYKVLVHDAHGCPDSLEVEVNQPEKLTIGIDSIADILCYGFKRGMIDVTVRGGVKPYTYSWSNQSNSEDLVNVSAGEYALLVTDANHCQEIISAEIKQNPLIVRSDEKVQNVECAGDNTGTIDIDVTGGVPPYQYRWTTGETSEDLNNLTAGKYTVQVTDSRGCLETYSTRVFEPDPIIINLEEVRNIYCAGDRSGAIDIHVEGGVKPYTYNWNDSLATTEDLAGLSAGEYNLLVQDARNCTKQLTQEITEPERIDVEISEVKDVVNFGESNGAIYLNVSGGIPPYNYEWSNGATTKDIANIPANNYTCRITDANNCVNTMSVNIEQPTKLEAEIKNLGHIKCYGERNGFIDVDVTGGVTPYDFEWSNGAATEDIRNLGAGTYSLIVTDAHGMVKTVEGTIEQPAELVSNLQSLSHNLCYGDQQGIADINVTGGTPPYSYNWSNGAKTQDITKVPAGDYFVQVIDNNHCVDTLEVTIEQNPQLEVGTSEIVDINCYGEAEGSVSISVNGGVSPYNYSWSNGAETPNLTNIKAGQYNLIVTDNEGCEKTLDVEISEPPLLESRFTGITDVKCKGDSTGAINLSVSGGTAPYSFEWSDGSMTRNNEQIKAGNYNVIITDDKGCINTLSATVEEPTELTSSIDQITNIDCFNELTGAVDVSVSGGIPPYIYKWSNGASTQNLAGIKAGNYTLTVNDQNGCETGLEATVEQNSRLSATIDQVTHVKCHGFKTGAAEISVEGGVEPYSYQWSNGAETKDLSGVGAGDYTLIVSDAKSCITSVNLSINEPPAFKGEITGITEIRCHGDANAAVHTSFEGGVEPYSFLWNNEETTKDIENLVAGTYTLIATDNNGCTDTLEAVLEQPTELELELISTVDNPCYGEQNGAIDIFVKGSVTPYTYEWSNGDSTQDLSNLAAGNYTVMVTGATGCSKSLSAEITEPAALELSVFSTEDIMCFGGNNGAIDLSVQGGVEPYLYSWSNGETTEDLSGLVAGSYTVNVVDKQGCSKEISAHIRQPEPLVASIVDVRDINCYGDSTGAISIDVTGGTLPYQYSWSNGETIEDISGLAAGEYQVEITDANGCQQNLMASIDQPEPLIADIVSVQDVLCKDRETGSINISVKGGVTPYIYSWSNGSEEQDIRNAGAGHYDVKVQDANGCIQTLEADITEPPMLNVAIDQVKHIMEYGRQDGSINLHVDGGESPYNYSWSNGAVTQNIRDLVAGNYSVIVQDANGCRKDLDVDIEQPDEIKISIDSVHHIYCYGDHTGYIKTSVRGGVKPYRYSWNNGVTLNELIRVPAGDYELTVTDANTASKTLKVTINQPPLFSLEIDSVLNPTCYELNNGVIKTRVRGGTTPYMFAWNTGATTQDLKGLTSGNYKITVKDARGCTLSDSVRLTKPEPLEVALLHVGHIKCHGERKGDVNISVRGGTPPYEYNWNHGSKEEDLTDVMAGNYTVKVVDANQCVQTISATVNEPPAMLASFGSVQNVPCKGESKGTITTSVTGGTPPYTYEWNTGDTLAAIQDLVAGQYSVAITDSNGCVSNLSTEITEPTALTGRIVNVNDIDCHGAEEGAINIDVRGGTLPYRFDWNNGSTDQNQSSIPAGDYSVKVTDAQGCELSLEATINEPPSLLASVARVEHINCFGNTAGSIDAAVTGGVEPYTYSWSNGATTQDLLNVAAGSYTLKVIDGNGCTGITSAEIEEPLPLIVETASINNNRCSGDEQGSITMSVKGGKEPYAYKWSNGATSRDIHNLLAGTYDLTVTDANGCVQTTQAVVNEPPELYTNIDAVNHITCNGQSNGSVLISVSEGTAPYSYQWSNGHTGQDLLGVPAGSYSVIVKEGNGCESQLEATITEPTPFISELVSVTHNECYGDENGSITISADGGTPPYSFRWNNGASKQNLTDIPAGDYSALVSDANGCNRTIKTTVNEPPRLVLKVDSARNVKCCGDTSGAIFISVTGGVAPYDYLWSHGKTTQDVTGLAEGQYTVTVTDANGCVVETPEEGATIYEKIISQGKFVSHDILFDVGKSDIKEESFIEISRIASFMKEHPELRFSIEGHTDSQGSESSNMLLSEQRAASVKESLIKFGIDGDRLETKGFGESVPIDTNATREGRANNRRVEFIPL